MEANDLRVWPIWSTGTWFIYMIYVGDHQTKLYTMYITCEPHGYRIEEFFLIFPIISLC